MRYYVILLSAFLFTGVYAQNANQERLENIVKTLASDDMLGRGFGSKAGDMAEAYIIDQFKKAGIEPFFENGYTHTFNHRSGVLNIEGANVVGVVRGTDPALADQYVIIGAHYDHVGWKYSEDGSDTIVYNGADDNASGVAAITEIGRIISSKKEKPGRSILIIAFDGEESGLIGSRRFVNDFISGDNPLIDAGKIAAMFSLDMVGMYKKRGGLELNGFEMLINHAELLANSAEKAPVSIVKMNAEVVRNTDTSPFAKAGIPAIHVFTGTVSPYHKPEDDSDLLDYEGMATVVDFVAALVEEISVSEKTGKVKQLENIEEKGGVALKRFNPGVIANLGGSYFDFKDDYYKAKSLFAASVGFMLETRISQSLALQPEVLYQWNGSQYSGGNLRTHSVTFPLSLLLTTKDDNNGVRVYTQLGGYYSYIFSGAQNSIALDFENIYNDYDYGIVFGVGMEIMNFRIGYILQSSLNDFTIDNPELNIIQRDVRLHSSSARIGWAF